MDRKKLTVDLMEKELPDIAVDVEQEQPRRSMREEYMEQNSGYGYGGAVRDEVPFDGGMYGAQTPPPPPVAPTSHRARNGVAVAAGVVGMLVWLFLMFVCPFKNYVPSAGYGEMETELLGREDVLADRPSVEITAEELLWIQEIAETDEVKYQLERFSPEHDDYAYDMLEDEDIPKLGDANVQYAGYSITKRDGEMYWSVFGSYENEDGTESYYISLEQDGKYYKNTDVFNEDGRRLYEYSVNEGYATKWAYKYTHHGLVALVYDMLRYGD